MSNIPFRVKLLTDTAKAPEQANKGDLWDLFADEFCANNLKDVELDGDDAATYKTIHSVSDNENYDMIDEFYTFEINHDSLYDKQNSFYKKDYLRLYPQGRILVKTGISLELPILWNYEYSDHYDEKWLFKKCPIKCNEEIAYAVADIRPRSGLALKHGITILNTPGTIDNSYRKEIGVILCNAGHKPYTINKGDKIAQMLIRPLYSSKMEIVKDIKDTGRGGYNSTGY